MKSILRSPILQPTKQRVVLVAACIQVVRSIQNEFSRRFWLVVAQPFFASAAWFLEQLLEPSCRLSVQETAVDLKKRALVH